MLLWLAGGFALLQVALVVALERLPRVRDVEYGTKLALVRRQLADNPGRPLMLALGSSEIMGGVRPDAIRLPQTPSGEQPMLFNFGLARQLPVLTNLCLRRLLHDGIRPRWLILEVAPAFLTHEMDIIDQTQWERMTVADLAALRAYAVTPGAFEKAWCGPRMAAWHSYRSGLLREYLPGLVPASVRSSFDRSYTDSGWLAPPPPADVAAHERYVAAARRVYEPLVQRTAVAPGTDRALRQTLALCRKEGIAVVLLLPPVGEVYRSWYAPATRACLDDYLARLSAESGAPLVDARDWVHEEDFRDSHHLLPDGAAAFSRRLNDEVLAPLVKGQPLPAGFARAEPRPGRR